MTISIKKKTDVYTKHHSFDTFISRINADVNQQKVRVLKAIQVLDHPRRGFSQEIFDSIKVDLESPDGLFKITPHIADELSKLDDKLIPRYIAHRYRYDVYPKLRKLDDYPPYLQIEPTSICNYRCVFCYQSDKTFSAKSSGQMGSMTLDLFKQVVDQIEGKVEFISLASRGEPLVCRDIDAMLEYCVGKFVGLKLNTNASLLTEQHCHAILAGGINTVVFSADAGEEPLYSQLRVGGTLENVRKKIELFQQIQNKHYPQSRLISRVSGVKVTDQQDMASMQKTWGDFVDQLMFVKYNPWENVYESPVNTVSAPCSDLWRRMFIWYDGKVNPCDTDYRSTLSVGDIQTHSIPELWQSEHYQLLRQRHISQERSQLNPCKRCTVI